MAGHRAARSLSRRGERGFTLIELLVVVTIIGILAAVVSVGVAGFTDQSKVKARQATVAGVQTAIDAYMAVTIDANTGKAVLPAVGFADGLADADKVAAGAGNTSGWYDDKGVLLGTQPLATESFFFVDMTELTGKDFLRLNASASGNSTTTGLRCILAPGAAATVAAGASQVKSRVFACHD